MSSVTPRYIISRIHSSVPPEAQTSQKIQPVIVQNKENNTVKTNKENLEKQAYNEGKSDFNNRIKYLLKSGSRYNKYLNAIMGYSNTQMREAEGLYPEFGQYKNVPQSGWQSPSLTSLYEQGALGTSDRIAIGGIDRKNQNRTMASGMYFDSMCDRLAQERVNEGGGWGPRQKHLSGFVKDSKKHFEDFMELKDLKERDDPISQLVAVEAEDMIKRFHILTNVEEMKKMTGIDMREAGIRDAFITKRLIPTPLNTNAEDGRSKPTTWYMRPDTRVIDVPYGKPETLTLRVKKQTPEGEKSEYITLEGQKPTKKKRIGEGEEIFNMVEKSDFWHYVKPYLLATPLSGFVDAKTGKSVRPVADLVKPYYTVSPLTHTFLEGYKKQMSELPGSDDPRLKKDFFEKEWLFGTGGKPIEKGAAGIPNITNMYGDSSAILAYHNPMGLDLILKYATATDPLQVDYNDFFKKRFKSLRNFQVNMNPDTLKNPFLETKSPIYAGKAPPMFADKIFDPQQDFGLIDKFQKLPGVGAYSLGKFW